MPINSRQDFTFELSQIREFRASLRWIAISVRYPKSGEHVLVRLADGRVEGGEWRDEEGLWTHSPFSAWGEPVAWAALTPSHNSPSFGVDATRHGTNI